MRIRKVAAGLLEMLYPRGVICLGCGNPLHTDPRTCLCVRCKDSLENLRLKNPCPRCMTPLNERGRCSFCHGRMLKYLKAGYSVFAYKGIARRLIWQMKFYWKDEAAWVLAEGMTAAFPPGGYDALVPVPLHKRRQHKRGANQAETLSKLVSHKAGLPVMTALNRISDTRSQVRLSAAQRRKNVKDAFACAENVEGLRLLLVDDIRTTGATAQECARVLLCSGAKEVGILTAAIALKKDEK